MTFRAIIIDDEPLARGRLRRLLDSIEQVDVIAVGENGQQAIELVNQHHPDLLFLDINMPVKNGLQAAYEIIDTPQPPAIIFCTAYDQYAIQAFKTQAAAYLLKPVMQEDVEQAIAQASQLNQLQLNSLSNEHDVSPVINIQHADYVEKKPLNELLYFRSQDKHVLAGSVDGTESIIDYTLKVLEQQFVDDLVRVHRNSLLNKAYLSKLQRDPMGQTSVLLKYGDRCFVVSRRHLMQVKRCFE